MGIPAGIWSGVRILTSIFQQAGDWKCCLTTKLPASHQLDYGYITNVNVGGIDNTSVWGTNGYADFTAQSATMQKGSGYALTVTCYNQHWPQNSIAVFVDWNRDGDFEDAGETVYTTVAAGPYSTTIHAPSQYFSDFSPYLYPGYRHNE